MSSEAHLTLEQAFQLAMQRFAAGDLAHAQTICRQILNAVPRQPRVLQLLGNIAFATSQLDAAIQNFRLALDAQPNDPGILVDLGNALLMAGQVEEAAQAYEKSLQLNPTDAGAQSNLGIALFELGRHDDALTHLRAAAGKDPARAELHNNLGHALKDSGRLEEAIAVLRGILNIKPDHGESLRNLAYALFDSGRPDEAMTICRDVLKKWPQAAAMHSMLLTLMLPDPQYSQQDMLAEHRSWNAMHAAPLASAIPAPMNDRSPDRRLRVGYVWPDVRDRSIAHFLEYLLACHDVQQFEIFCYADLQHRADPAAQRLMQSASQWRNITGFGDRRLVQQIRQDQIDILIDLTGHHPANRLMAFAYKPAPVQISYLGYPFTTGLDAIDYRLSDAIADPPGADGVDEGLKLIRLHRSFISYRPPEDAPPIAAQPAVARGTPTWGSFAPLPRISSALIRLWSYALRRVPEARLLLSNFSFRDAAARELVRSRFVSHHIDPSRLDLRPDADSTVQRLAVHNEVDVVLDPHPYSDMAGTCEALWMGVPVVTFNTISPLSRTSASILTHLGLPELVAEDELKFLQMITAVTRDLPKLGSLRKTLRDRMRQSPLMGGFRFARDVEREYRNAWKRWCAAV